MIAQTLRRGGFHDEVLLDGAENVTVSEVRMTPDLKKATVYVIGLGGTEGGVKMDKILPALNKARAYFQREINHSSNLKFTPRVHFVIDYSFEEAQRIEKILSSLPEIQEET